MATSDDDSSGEGREGSKESKESKSSSKSRKSRRATDDTENMNGSDNNLTGERKKKKKSKRKTSISMNASSEQLLDVSDVETDGGGSSKRSARKSKDRGSYQEAEGSDVETDGGSKRSARKAKGGVTSNRTKMSTTPTEDVANAPLKGSMLLTIRNKRNQKMMNGENNQRKEMSKNISFSGSTIVRDVERQKRIGNNASALDIAMGKIPPSAQDASSSENDNNTIEGNLMANMDKIHNTDNSNVTEENNTASSGNKGSGGSLRTGALKSGKYTPKKKHATFGSIVKVDEEPEASRGAVGGRKKPTFRPVEYGSEDDSPTGGGRRMPSRSNSFNNLNGGSRGNGGSLTRRHTDEPPISRQPSWQPEGIPSRAKSSKLRRSKTGSDDSPNNKASSDDGLRNSLTLAQRPGIQRRNTMGSITHGSNRRSSKDLGLGTSGGSGGGGGDDKDGTGAGGTNVDRRTTLTRMTQSIAINQHKQIRRLEMSEEHQTYIPPKSRNPGIFQAMTHLISGRVVDLTLWTYQASFFKVMLFFLAFYIINIFVWAAVLDAVDLASGGQCIHEDPEGMSRNERYEFVFELSWATFTTVGYGTISPQGDMTGCYAIRFTCAFVAFIGVLFASQTAAIMYSKLMRLLAKAHVTFSSILCVQYGKGNEGSTVRFGQLNFRASVAPAALMKFSASDLLDESNKEEESPAGSEDGFPVIEFRMINDRANHEGSEIWDAQIRGIVQLKKEQSSDGNTGNFSKDKGVGGESTLDLEKKVYYPISLSPDTHPHFSRIWYARHTLNAESPLLKRDYRDMIVKDGGKWDKEFNNWEEIREALNPFISLRITLSGTSAVSASTVYGEHVYEFDDVCVGWRFANMVYEKKERAYKSWWRRLGLSHATKEDEEMEQRDKADADGRTKIDAALLHDIVPQPGGDFEPLNETKNTNQPGNVLLKIVTLGMHSD